MQVELHNVTPKAEESLVHIARASSQRVDKTENQAGLINFLIKNNHWSPFEHSFMTVEIKTSKAIAIQLLRHRSFTFQEFSQRYAKVNKMEAVDLRRQAVENRQSSTDTIGMIVMGEFYLHEEASKEEHALVEEFSRVLDQTQDFYNRMIDAGVAKECARMILPMCTETTLYMTGPIRSWIHMLDLRDHSHAQLEAQLIAKEIKNIFIDQFPIVAEARGYEKYEE